MDPGPSEPTAPPATPADAAPPPGAAPAPPLSAPVFYRINLSRATFTECRAGVRLHTAILVWVLLKLLGRIAPASCDDPAVESLDPFRIEEEKLPEPIRQLLQPATRDFTLMGFHAPVYHAIDDALHSTRTFLATFPHQSLPVIARIHNRHFGPATPQRNRLFFEFITAYPDDTFLWSIGAGMDLLSPPSCRVQRRPGATTMQLWNLHEQTLQADPRTREALPANTPEQTLTICNRLHDAVRTFHLSRGVFAPLKGTDHRRRDTIVARRTQVARVDSKNADVLVELEAIQHKKTGWRGAALLLVLSIIFFLVIGIRGVSLLRVLALVPILLFHELGHFLAMKAFGYRNLRMFFIPGFGAAVTGRHFNVPGWKKAIVALMGPVPGIFLGIIIGLCGILWKSTFAVQAAILTLALNGLNLLPVLPLDGGHVVHTVLFARHRVLDISFRVLAALALVGVAIALRSAVFSILAFFMLLGLPQTIRVARTVRELRREGAAPASPDDQTIPPAVAEQIITRLRAGAKRPQFPKLVAQETLQVFEALNTRAPGWLASAGLMLTYALSFAAAAVFIVVFALAQRGSLDRILHPANRPRHAIVAPATRTPSAPAASGPARTIIATFTTGARAASAYTDALAQLGDAERATLLGDTLFIRFPATDDAARVRWLERLHPLNPEIFVDSKSLVAYFHLQMTAPSQADAAALQAELQEYFELPLRQGVVPPWSPTVALTPEQALARRTYARLSTSNFALWNDPELKQLRQRATQAQHRGDDDEYRSLAAQERTLTTTLRHARAQAIADEPAGTIDTALARRYVQLLDTLEFSKFYDAAPREFAPLLGLASDSQPGADATHALTGSAQRTGLVINLYSVSFADPGAGAAALCTWLSARGCTALRYDVSAEPLDPDETDDPLPDTPGPP